jgi:hypothetical protein
VTISGFSRFGEGPAFTPRLSRELIEPPLCERLKHESFDPRLGAAAPRDSIRDT